MHLSYQYTSSTCSLGSPTTAGLLCSINLFLQLPRVSIADWKPGNVGVPMFHCKRCLRNWFRSGGLLPECSEPEDFTEGPAMCITFSDQTSSEMIVSGVLGEDGKPVRIKVAKPEAIKLLLIKKGTKRGVKGVFEMQTANGSKMKDRRLQRSGGGRYSAEESSEGEPSLGEEEEQSELDLPEDIRKYILRQERRRRRRRRRKREQGHENIDGPNPGSCSPDSTSSSSYESGNDSESLVNEQTKQNGRRQRSHGKGKTAAKRRRRRHRDKRRHGGAGGSQSSSEEEDEWSSDSSCVRSKVNGDTHLPPIATGGQQQCMRKGKTLQKDCDYEEHLPEIEGVVRYTGHSGDRRGSIVSERERSRMSRMPNSDGRFQLPHISESRLSANTSSIGCSSREHRLPSLSPGHPTVSQEDAPSSTGGPDAGAGKTKGGHSSLSKHLDSRLPNGTRRGSHQFPTGPRRGSVMRSTQVQDSSTSQSDKHSQKGRATGGKMATVLHDVHVPVKQTEGMLKKGRRKGNPKKVSKRNDRKIRISTPPERTSTSSRRVSTHEVIPAIGDDQLTADGATDRQKPPPQPTDDGHPKRIGRKIVKKTRKPPEPQSSAVNHNSKDLGDVAGYTQTDEQTRGVDRSYRSGTLPTLPEGVEFALAERGYGQEDPSRLLGTPGHGSGCAGPVHAIPSATTDFLPQPKASLRAGGRAGRESGSTSELLSSGLGAKESEMRSHEVPPVKLKPISQSTDQTILGSADVELQTAQGQLQGMPPTGHALPPEGLNTSARGPGHHSPEPGSDIVTEEEEEEEEEGEESDGEEEPVFPVYKLRELTGLCFTSPYSFSLFPMATQYQEVYSAVRRRALQPVSVARLNPRKLLKGRKR